MSVPMNAKSNTRTEDVDVDSAGINRKVHELTRGELGKSQMRESTEQSAEPIVSRQRRLKGRIRKH